MRCGPPVARLRFWLNRPHRLQTFYLGRSRGAGDGNRTRMTSLEGVWRMAVRAAELGALMLLGSCS
jgi:hypothetical protein